MRAQEGAQERAKARAKARAQKKELKRALKRAFILRETKPRNIASCNFRTNICFSLNTRNLGYSVKVAVKMS